MIVVECGCKEQDLQYTINHMKTSNFIFKNELVKQRRELIIGVDEAGRGPLAGPVVACAVILKKSKLNSDVLSWNLIRDSKKLSEKQREEIFDFIHENFYVGIGLCSHKTIDRINILQATFLAMKKAVFSLMRGISLPRRQTGKFQFLPPQRDLIRAAAISNKIPSFNNKKFKNTRYKISDTKYIILVDGNKKIPNLNFKQRAIVGGDKSVKSISAASIIAKVTRDRLMRKWHKKYPQYEFAKHKGYGTKLHIERLKKFGPSSIHRLSFQPAKANLLAKARL